MDVSSEEIEIPVPLNSRYGHTQITHHHHDPVVAPHKSVQTTIPTNMNKDTIPYSSKIRQPGIRYKECLKNHAAAMGGNVTDGCGEFMPSGSDLLEAFICSVCHCHRNFHRKLVGGDDEGESEMVPYLNGTRAVMGHNYPPRTTTPHQMIVPYNVNNGSFFASGSDEKGYAGGGMAASARPYNHHQVLKKRFRTKFTQQQKEKMMSFAEKVGWKIQREEESVVQQLCQEIGVKRRVLKVWMHNNKHNLAKNNINSTSA